MRSIWTCQSHRHCKTRHQWLDIKNGVGVGGVYVTVSCSDNEIVGIEAGRSGCSNKTKLSLLIHDCLYHIYIGVIYSPDKDI